MFFSLSPLSLSLLALTMHVFSNTPNNISLHFSFYINHSPIRRKDTENTMVKSSISQLFPLSYKNLSLPAPFSFCTTTKPTSLEASCATSTSPTRHTVLAQPFLHHQLQSKAHAKPESTIYHREPVQTQPKNSCSTSQTITNPQFCGPSINHTNPRAKSTKLRKPTFYLSSVTFTCNTRF